MVMRETGTVLAIQGDRAAIQVRRAPQTSAGQAPRLRSGQAAGKACRGCTACRPMGNQGLVLWVAAKNLKEGDEVTVEVPLPNPWHGIGLVFALPLAALVAGLAIGNAWTGWQTAVRLGPEAAGIMLGGALALSAFGLARLYERRFDRRHPPRVVEVRLAPQTSAGQADR